MNVQSPKNRIAHSILALSICAMVPLPSLATDFLNPPGNYDYYHWFGAGTNVPTGVTRPNYTTGTSAIKLGEDYYIDGKVIGKKMASSLPTDSFGYRANNRYGILVYKAGDPVLGCSNSCTITVEAANEICTSFEFQFGIDGQGSTPNVPGVTLTLSASASASVSGCLGRTNGWQFTSGYRSSSTYLQAVTGIEYKYARVATTARKIHFRPSIVSASTSDAKLIAAHRLCLQQGWASSQSDSFRNNITLFKQTIAYTGGYCYVPNSNLTVYVYGPHPDGAVFAESYATRRVGKGDFITSFEDAEDIY